MNPAFQELHFRSICRMVSGVTGFETKSSIPASRQFPSIPAVDDMRAIGHAGYLPIQFS